MHIFGVLTSENLNNLTTVHAETVDRGESGKHSTNLFDDEKDPVLPALEEPTPVKPKIEPLDELNASLDGLNAAIAFPLAGFDGNLLNQLENPDEL